MFFAVSGEKRGALVISHFLQLKGKKQAIPKFGDQLKFINKRYFNCFR